jgi:valyl-tRNA synthetase
MEPKIKENAWNPELEKAILDSWKNEPKLYAFAEKSKKKLFTIDTPPPYPSGSWHIGAVAHYSEIDMIARTARMRGFNVLFPMGLDRNGINIERTVEKKYNKPMHLYDRAEFIDKCRQEIDKISEEMLFIAKRMGMSCDFSDVYCTDSEEYRMVSQSVFIDLFNKGLIYEDYRPNNYCPSCRTTIADAELYYEELPTALNYLRFKVKETAEDISIATTRPELLCACQAVLVHPEDERYKRLHGKNITLPIYDRNVPIIPHNYAKPDFGTGIVMVCSYGDLGDVSLFRELNLEPVVAIGGDGKMTERAGKYHGKKPVDARKEIVEDLKKAGLIEKEEKTIHRTPICERSKTPVEFVAMHEWYLTQLPYLDDLRKQADEMTFYQQQHKQTLLNWIDAVTMDWPISRRRYYHTEVPIWKCKQCEKAVVPKPGKYYRPWAEKPPFDKCPHCGGKEFEGETRVFDTWMDSSISSLYVTGYLRKPALFKKAYPCTIRPQGREIIRTWLYYTMLKNRLLFDKKAFEQVWISGVGLDAHGRKMSKSLGNVIDPIPILEKHGADAFRLWAAGEANIGEDFKISEDRIQGASKFLTKLWNTARFISSFPQPKKKPAKLADTDKWILGELNALVKECDAAYSQFNFFVPATRVREFVWSLFAPHYLEMVKPRAYEGDESALWTLYECLQTVLRLLAPVTPFMTDKVYKELYGGSVHEEELPKPEKTEESSFTKATQFIIEFNSQIWKQKKDGKLPLSAEISGVKIPDGIRHFETDLKKMHRLKE